MSSSLSDYSIIVSSFSFASSRVAASRASASTSDISSARLLTLKIKDKFEKKKAFSAEAVHRFSATFRILRIPPRRLPRRFLSNLKCVGLYQNT